MRKVKSLVKNKGSTKPGLTANGRNPLGGVPVVRNKGSSKKKSLHRLGKPSQRPQKNISSTIRDGADDENTQNGRNLKYHWNEFVNWLFATALRYAKIVVLLGLGFLIFQIEHTISHTSGPQLNLSLLQNFSLIWLTVEGIEAYTGFPIGKKLLEYFEKLFPPK